MRELIVGEKASIKKSFSENEIIEFSRISLDKNPIHLDKNYASTTVFEKPIVHGFLSGSLISAVLGTTLPGPGAIYLEQNMKFMKPVYPGDMIEAYVEVSEKIKNKIYRLKTWCVNQNGETVIDGTAVIKY